MGNQGTGVTPNDDRENGQAISRIKERGQAWTHSLCSVYGTVFQHKPGSAAIVGIIDRSTTNNVMKLPRSLMRLSMDLNVTLMGS